MLASFVGSSRLNSGRGALATADQHLDFSDGIDFDLHVSLPPGWVRPHVDFDAELADLDGKWVLLVRVNAGAEPPYGVATTDRKIDYYVRRSGTTFPASPADVRAFVQERFLSQMPTQGYLPR